MEVRFHGKAELLCVQAVGTHRRHLRAVVFIRADRRMENIRAAASIIGVACPTRARIVMERAVFILNYRKCVFGYRNSSLDNKCPKRSRRLAKIVGDIAHNLALPDNEDDVADDVIVRCVLCLRQGVEQQRC